MSDPHGEVKMSAILKRVKFLESKRQSLLNLVLNLVELSKKVSSGENRRYFLMRTLTLERTQAEYSRVIDQLIEAKLEADADFSPSYESLVTFDYLICSILMVKSDISAQPELFEVESTFDFFKEDESRHSVDTESEIQSYLPPLCEDLDQCVQNVSDIECETNRVPGFVLLQKIKC